MASATQKGSTKTAPRNAAEWLSELERVFLGLKSGRMKPREAREINKSAGRFIKEERARMIRAEY
jgi:hypothetical protein